mmetsp:Transcript_22157/g.33818  ORF Transcript_22157/g.33818 Transcript_22157/m.33818 type:complete len:223 (+) Transcript_22157:1-669(+)
MDEPTEVGYVYQKNHTRKSEIKPNDKSSSIPRLRSVLWEKAKGEIVEETLTRPAKSLTESVADVLKGRSNKKSYPAEYARSRHSGDGSVPYLSLIWAHTWLLHPARTSEEKHNQNPLDSIEISHRPQGGSSWIMGRGETAPTVKKPKTEDGDTGTSHPHGTKYKPEMVRYASKGTSHTSGEYTTTIIEAIGVEHKETTRNYDILAAVFTDVLTYMHDDLGLL